MLVTKKIKTKTKATGVYFCNSQTEQEAPWTGAHYMPSMFIIVTRWGLRCTGYALSSKHFSRFGYCCYCSDCAPATNRMLVQQLIITSPNPVHTQCDRVQFMSRFQTSSLRKLCEHCCLCATASIFSKGEIESKHYLFIWTYTATKKFPGQLRCVRLYRCPVSSSKLV